MIRACTIDEVAKFADLGAWFFGTLQLPGSFNAESFRVTWSKLIGSGAGFILARFDSEQPVEAIGAIEFSDYMNNGELTAAANFWFYIEEPKGLEAGLLHEAFEFDCRQRGVKHVWRGALCNDRLARVGAFLIKSGYQLAEMQYRKTL